jgi:hypothetical protein
MAYLMRRGGALVLGTLLSAACGNGDDLDDSAGAGISPPIEIQPAIERPDESGGSAGAGDGDDTDGENGPIVGGPDPAQPSTDPNVCVTPVGVSGTPRTLSEAMILMNSLPKPTSLACFLQALSRPLDVYLTSSNQSLQPSPGPRSPRTFIVFEPLVLSIVFEGDAQIALELGYRTTPTRSIKTEILFPIERDVTYANFFDEVQVGEATRCGACHTSEVQALMTDAFPVDVFESDILEPFDSFEVDVESLRSERMSCDPAAEPERCELLSAFFDFGTVRAAPQGITF